MGTYIYSLRSPKLIAKVKLDNGDIVTVGRYAFEYKPIWSCFRDEPRWQILAKARILRLQKIWDNYIDNGGSYPQAGVIVSDKKNGYKINVGDYTYAWSWANKSLPIEIEDCTMSGAKQIGKIVEVLS